MENQLVVKLNADGSFIGEIPIRDAINLIFTQRAFIAEPSQRILHTSSQFFDKTRQWTIPGIIQLVKLSKNIFRIHAPFSRQNLFIRDNFKCCYCGSSHNLTIDHIIPKCHGGKTCWLNCVVACFECNQKKGNIPLNKCGLRLQVKPRIPSLGEIQNKERWTIDAKYTVWNPTGRLSRKRKRKICC